MDNKGWLEGYLELYFSYAAKVVEKCRDDQHLRYLLVMNRKLKGAKTYYELLHGRGSWPENQSDR